MVGRPFSKLKFLAGRPACMLFIYIPPMPRTPKTMAVFYFSL